MKTIVFKHLIDSKTGEPVELEVPDFVNEDHLKAMMEFAADDARRLKKILQADITERDLPS